MGKKTDKSNFENNLNRLDEIAALLESDDIGLEEAIALYEEGIELSKTCISTLKNAELKITELKKKLDNISGDKNLSAE
jgi:exodeoxyribonuclease VII small subunit